MAQSGCQERCSDSQANKDFQDRLSKMQAERAKQDTMWTSISTGSNESQTSIQPTESISLGVKSNTQTPYHAYDYNTSHR